MSSIIIALIDAAFILLLTWLIKPARFRELKWPLSASAAFFWSIFGIALVLIFWNSFYQYFYPGWFHFGGILVFVPVLFGALALAFHWLALRMPGNPILAFCLLGGLESIFEHIWGIYGLKILDVPMLQDATPASILAFSFPEYIFYWCFVISLAVIIQTGWKRWANYRKVRPGNTA